MVNRIGEWLLRRRPGFLEVLGILQKMNAKLAQEAHFMSTICTGIVHLGVMMWFWPLSRSQLGTCLLASFLGR
jgi:hypothetical protein